MVLAELAQIWSCAGCCGALDGGRFCPTGDKWLRGGGVLGVRSAVLAAANLAFIKAFFRNPAKALPDVSCQGHRSQGGPGGTGMGKAYVVVAIKLALQSGEAHSSRSGWGTKGFAAAAWGS